MSIINIDNMYREMQNTMQNNFGVDLSAEKRFELAKAQFLESVADAIEQNKEELIKEDKEEN